MPISELNSVTVEGAELGRFLFYDSILSRDYSVSCASCHQQAFAFSDGPKRFSTGIDEQLQTRNTLPLFNLAWYDAYFWDGRAATIEAQALHPVRSHGEMDLDWKTAMERIRKSPFYRKQFRLVFNTERPDSIQISYALAQFERTLLSYNSKYDSVFRGETYFTSDEYAGFILLNDQTKGDCLHCHTTDADGRGTIGKFLNNGLDFGSSQMPFSDPGRGAITGKANEMGQFKIPSLRNLAFTAPYMHDGRFATLEEVLRFYNTELKFSHTVDPRMRYVHQGGAHLSPKEIEQITAFLMTLNDSVFINEPAFKNPFP